MGTGLRRARLMRYGAGAEGYNDADRHPMSHRFLSVSNMTLKFA